VALSQIDNVSPNLGQSYIIDSHGGGVRRRRTRDFGRCLHARHRQQVPEPVAGAVLGKTPFWS
jgi:hypothetical protein